jgi:hypothetical protein
MPSYVSTNGFASTVPAGSAGMSIVVVPLNPVVTSPVVAPSLTNPPASVHVPWSNTGCAPKRTTVRT